MKHLNFKKAVKHFFTLSLIGAMVFATSCKEDEVEPTTPVASFQSEISTTNFLEVQFSNFSQNATSYSWNFGDGETSIEENPLHLYSAAGSYEVTLTATDDASKESVKTETVVISDPDEALTLLTGLDSKTWKLFREGTSMQLGPDAGNPGGYWSGLTNNGTRNCLYEQTFTFQRDGGYVFDDQGMFWGEFGVWADTDPNFETCFEAIPANMKNKDNADVSAWLSGTHAFTYDAETGTVTLSGMGAWIGIPKLTTAGTTTIPVAETKFDINIVEETGYDLMYLTFTYEGELWSFVYASYTDESLEPELVAAPEPPSSIEDINFDFESEELTWGIFGGTDFNGAGVSLTRIDNPDATGINTSTKVMDMSQVADVQGWSGISTVLAGSVDFTNKQVFKVKVWSPKVGTTVKFKLEASDNADNNKEIDATTTVANQWEELTFTFDAADSNKWNVLVLFFDFQTVVKAEASTYYFDDIVLQ